MTNGCRKSCADTYPARSSVNGPTYDAGAATNSASGGVAPRGPYPYVAVAQATRLEPHAGTLEQPPVHLKEINDLHRHARTLADLDSVNGSA